MLIRLGSRGDGQVIPRVSRALVGHADVDLHLSCHGRFVCVCRAFERRCNAPSLQGELYGLSFEVLRWWRAQVMATKRQRLRARDSATVDVALAQWPGDLGLAGKRRSRRRSGGMMRISESGGVRASPSDCFGTSAYDGLQGVPVRIMNSSGFAS